MLTVFVLRFGTGLVLHAGWIANDESVFTPHTSDVWDDTDSHTIQHIVADS